jgi:hypothetical protein
MLYGRTKHIDVVYHFIRGITAEDDTKICKISTYDNPVDILINSIYGDKCLNLVGICYSLSPRDFLRRRLFIIEVS